MTKSKGLQNNGWLGRKHTPETLEKMRISHLGQIPWCKGKNFSDEHKKSIKEGMSSSEKFQKACRENVKIAREVAWRKTRSDKQIEQLKKASKNSWNKPRTQKQLDASSRNGKLSFKGDFRILKGRNLKYCPEHPNRMRNHVYFSRIVVEKQIGRYLTSKEIVHHEDRNKSNDEIFNLIAFTSQSAHMRWHKNPANVKPEEIIFDGRKIHTI